MMAHCHFFLGFSNVVDEEEENGGRKERETDAVQN